MLIINIKFINNHNHHKNLILGPGTGKSKKLNYPFNSIVPFSNFSFNFIKNTYTFRCRRSQNFFKDKLDPFKFT